MSVIQTDMPPLESSVLPSGVRSRLIDGVNGLRMHFLEAGFETAPRPLVLLLHGFPELAYSWRKVLPAIAAAGYHVIAPDQRGYGRTTGWDNTYDGDVESFYLLNIVKDTLALVFALGRRSVDCVVGHDFGSPVAQWCAVTRPDIFRSVVLMSSPFVGAPTIGTSRADGSAVHKALAALDPPRKHYQWHHSTPQAEADIRDCPQGIHDFLRAYYHVKSGDWAGNRPFPIKSWTAEELAKLPRYYVMDLNADMASTVAPFMPTADEIAKNTWLPDSELNVYSSEFSRTGFQGALLWYRCRTERGRADNLEVFAGRTIDIPSLFIAGARDWGIQQIPGGLERMQTSGCTRMEGCHLIENAGHWVQQEQPEKVIAALLPFLERHARRT